VHAKNINTVTFISERRRIEDSGKSRNPKNLRSLFTLLQTERVELVAQRRKINRFDSATRNWITSCAHEGTERSAHVTR